MKAKHKQKQAKVAVDYGRRVRNRLGGEGEVRVIIPRAVIPHSGPKPRVYPIIDWTPLAWRVS